MTIQRTTMTVQEAASYIGVSSHLIYALARRGEIPVVKVGRRVLLKRDSVDRWLNENETEVEAK